MGPDTEAILMDRMELTKDFLMNQAELIRLPAERNGKMIDPVCTQIGVADSPQAFTKDFQQAEKSDDG